MNENINLCELLKGHEGETFYSPIAGKVRLKGINSSDKLFPIITDICNYSEKLSFSEKGLYRHFEDGECMLFPSKDQRDWNKWAKEQKPKVPKTWNELCRNTNVEFDLGVKLKLTYDDWAETTSDTPIEKSALALLKIHQLIEVGYGGNITNEEWKKPGVDKFIIYYHDNHICVSGADHNTLLKHHIAFHTEAQVEEFLSYPENVQLVKDFYQI